MQLTRQWAHAKQMTWILTNEGLLLPFAAGCRLHQEASEPILYTHLRKIGNGSVSLSTEVAPCCTLCSIGHFLLLTFWVQSGHTTQWERSPSSCAIARFASLSSWHIL